MSSQDIQDFTELSEVEGGKREAAEGHEKDEKGGSDEGKGTYEYRKGREVEVRDVACGEGGGGRGGSAVG